MSRLLSSLPTLLCSLLAWGLLWIPLTTSVTGMVATAEARDPAPEPAAEAEKIDLDLQDWWIAGPVAVRTPAFADEDYGLAELLAEPNAGADGMAPALGRRAHGLASAGTEVGWREAAVAEGQISVQAASSEGKGGAVGGVAPVYRARLATYLRADRFAVASLSVAGPAAARILLDGEELATRKSGSESPTDAELVLAPGSHLLVLDTAFDKPTWEMQAGLSLAAEHEGALRAERGPKRNLHLGDLLDSVTPSSVELSADGRAVAITLQKPAVPADHRERWIEVRDTDSGEVLRTMRGGEGNFTWSPVGNAYVYTDSDPSVEGASRIFLASLGGGNIELLARGLEHLEGLTFFPDGQGLILTLGEPAEEDERGVKRYRQLTDRWSGWRNSSHLYSLDLEGNLRRLTAGRSEDALEDIAPGGDRLVVSRRQQGLTQRPYSLTELLEIDLESLQSRPIAELGWFGQAQYSPDGEKLLILGSPALFDGAGNPLEEGRIANDYDTQAFMHDLGSGETVALSREFEPSILAAKWSRHDGEIYFRVQDREHTKLYRFDPDNPGYSELPTGVEMVGSASIAAAASRLAFVGQGVNRPPAIYVGGTDGAREARLLHDPAEDAYADVEFGRVEPWSFEAQDGTEIDGRVYYPAEFDSSRSYPLIVYYYGGTTPVGRSFGGRYPKELWAARGYVVYVPQPSGAIGYGQEFSARHVNAWGRRTADEIIEGTQKFLASHPFVDSSRVGAIGASYGGFMTMYLQTRTDIFAAAVSHAGISNLSSYWGRGWWGYLYSAAASAESFPWNNRELYVDQSPLFSADKIHTPLLLLHGDADVNVPPVESHQMYTALKLLGREVELIEIGGENHTILTYPKRQIWARTILAWFDRYLKNQPEEWEHLWGTDDEPKG